MGIGKGTGMQIHGAMELDAKLAALGRKVGKRIARRAIRVPAERVRNRAKLNLARVTTERTGELDRSIGLKFIERKGVATYIVGPRISGGFKGFHGHLIEFGTRPRVQGLFGRYVGAVKPRPFLRPAFDSLRESNLVLMRKILREGIEREARKAANAAGRAA